MAFFKKQKKQPAMATELKCQVEGCSFTTPSPEYLKRHLDWRHPELAQGQKKA